MGKQAPVPLVQTATGLPRLPLEEFAARLAQALPPLVAFLNSSALRNHPKWGRLMPYNVPGYGNQPSPGHVVRPDVLFTDGGPKITELDFVPSGRGWTWASLPPAEQVAFLEAFAQWYRSLGYDTIYYATGTTTVCWEESKIVSSLMRKHFDLDMHAVNVDETPLPRPGLVDRLFYRAELRRPFIPRNVAIATAEPYLDSKMIFAIIHDPQMTPMLSRALGAYNLAFLRNVMIRSYLLSDVLAGQTPLDLERDVIGTDKVAARKHWVLKSTEVEETWGWGCRGVMLGGRYSRAVWAAALRGVNPERKQLGQQPILQEFAPSRDFAAVWDAIAAGRVIAADASQFGKPEDPTVFQPAKRLVYARVGLYFLLNNRTGKVIVPSQGILTLRQDPLAHGASDARIAAFSAV